MTEPSERLHMVCAEDGDEALARALALVRFLRTRCPWDAKQTPQSLRPYLLEEAHEVADAIASGDDEQLESELGDLLLNVAFQIVLAEERGAFRSAGVAGALEEKMEARHPHVYGDAESPPDWEAMKAEERRNRAQTGRGERAGDRRAGEPQAGPGQADERRNRASQPGVAEPAADPFAGVSAGLDPLSRAARVQERMAALGFDWPDLAGPLEKVREEADELARAAAEPSRATVRPGGADSAPGPPADQPDGATVKPDRVASEPGPTADEPGGAAGEPNKAPVRIGEASEAVMGEVGDLLFAGVNASRLAGAHPANALLVAIDKFERRCRRLVELAASRGIDCQSAGLETLDAIWDEVKIEERKADQ